MPRTNPTYPPEFRREAIRLVRASKQNYPIPRVAREIGVSKSGYYAWRKRPPSKRVREDVVLTETIREIHSRSRQTYGVPRVHAELRLLGIVCGRRRVARLMRAAGLRGCIRSKRRRTTRRDPRAAPAPDLLRRDFVAREPNRIWLADITYVPTREDFLYLAFILDVHSRRIVGWSMGSHMRTELVIDALEMAVWRRKPGAGLIHHTDRGSQYTAISFGKRLEEVGIMPSMGRTGSALDNAMAESFIATLKTELVHRRRFPDREVARSAIFEYLEGFYNRRRLHSALSYQSPMSYEEATMEGAAVA